MNGVMIPSVSAGSNQVGASETVDRPGQLPRGSGRRRRSRGAAGDEAEGARGQEVSPCRAGAIDGSPGQIFTKETHDASVPEWASRGRQLRSAGHGRNLHGVAEILQTGDETAGLCGFGPARQLAPFAMCRTQATTVSCTSRLAQYRYRTSRRPAARRPRAGGRVRRRRVRGRRATRSWGRSPTVPPSATGRPKRYRRDRRSSRPRQDNVQHRIGRSRARYGSKGRNTRRAGRQVGAQ